MLSFILSAIDEGELDVEWLMNKLQKELAERAG